MGLYCGLLKRHELVALSEDWGDGGDNDEVAAAYKLLFLQGQFY